MTTALRSHSAMVGSPQSTRTQPGESESSTASWLARRMPRMSSSTTARAGVRIRFDLGNGAGLKEHAFVRRAAGHREVAKSVPDFAPRYFGVGAVFETGRAHGYRLDVFVTVLIFLREDGHEPELQSAQGGVFLFAQRSRMGTGLTQTHVSFSHADILGEDGLCELVL